MAPQGRRNADGGDEADKLRVSMGNLLLGGDPIVSANKKDQLKDEPAKTPATADVAGGETEKIIKASIAASQPEGNKEASASAAVDGGDAPEIASEDASSCSHGGSSDECSDCKKNCSDCGEADEGNVQEDSTSAKDTTSANNTDDAHGKGSSVGADADQSSSGAASAKDTPSVSESNAGESSDKAMSAGDASGELSDNGSSAHNSSGPESGGGDDQDSSGKGDDASTGISTPGADSSNEGASDQGNDEATSKENDDDDSKEDSGTGPASESGWSISEDHLLRGMKEAGDVTWAEIGKALNRGKNEVKARWKVIQKADAEGNAMSADKKSFSATGNPQSTSAAKPSGVDREARKPGKANDPQATSSEGNQADTESACEASAAAKGPVGKDKGKGKAPASASDRVAKWRQNKDKNAAASEDQAVSSEPHHEDAEEEDYEEDDEYNAEPVVLSGEEASSESSIIIDGKDGDEDNDDDEDYNATYYGHKTRGDVRYLHNEIYRELYPDMVDLKPDECFGEEDCAVLAAMDSKYKRSRYLEMQANFYNVTGRLIPLHLIRDKIERAEKEEAEEEAGRGGRSVMPKPATGAASSSAAERHDEVEKWVEGLEDAAAPDAAEASGPDGENAH
ncbi:hypothetical protein JDV02_005373 [Purpureocillium takamizusanense]|uniref:Myb-like domain-containing protein n=1 Tax=Purpureocillium takamizusanense TaxID=2060973 RepID=A0A9Q8QGD4_9HYPO|nr:uncharacterized protein JDV02_005373 [Purpureocillium takamizusanense]UNI19165.1 hypothetical protein JDV02_005373 [Purpureocillium takamizusanense]